MGPKGTLLEGSIPPQNQFWLWAWNCCNIVTIPQKVILKRHKMEFNNFHHQSQINSEVHTQEHSHIHEWNIGGGGWSIDLLNFRNFKPKGQINLLVHMHKCVRPCLKLNLVWAGFINFIFTRKDIFLCTDINYFGLFLNFTLESWNLLITSERKCDIIFSFHLRPGLTLDPVCFVLTNLSVSKVLWR